MCNVLEYTREFVDNRATYNTLLARKIAEEESRSFRNVVYIYILLVVF